MLKLYNLVYEPEDPAESASVWPIFLDYRPTAFTALRLMAKEEGLEPEDFQHYEDAINEGRMDVQGPWELPTGPDAAEVLRALARVNAQRRRLGQPLLEPVVAGWTPQDVLDEDRRLRHNPAKTKADLLR